VLALDHGRQRIRVGEEGRVDLVVRNKVLELEGPRATFDLRRLEVLVVEVDEFALADLERLDDLVVRHRLPVPGFAQSSFARGPAAELFCGLRAISSVINGLSVSAT
jgi:hypothetical protein